MAIPFGFLVLLLRRIFDVATWVAANEHEIRLKTHVRETVVPTGDVLSLGPDYFGVMELKHRKGTIKLFLADSLDAFGNYLREMNPGARVEIPRHMAN